jgi:hypothetical protein
MSCRHPSVLRTGRRDIDTEAPELETSKQGLQPCLDIIITPADLGHSPHGCSGHSGHHGPGHPGRHSSGHSGLALS